MGAPNSSGSLVWGPCCIRSVRTSSIGACWRGVEKLEPVSVGMGVDLLQSYTPRTLRCYTATMLGKTQLNVRLEEDLVKELRVEAAQMGLRLGTYIELILGKRQEILK